MAKCLIDEHISPALAKALRVVGIDVVTLKECGFSGRDIALTKSRY